MSRVAMAEIVPGIMPQNKTQGLGDFMWASFIRKQDPVSVNLRDLITLDPDGHSIKRSREDPKRPGSPDGGRRNDS